MFFVISLVVTLFGIAAIGNFIKSITGFDLISAWVGNSPVTVGLVIILIVAVILIIRRRRKK